MEQVYGEGQPSLYGTYKLAFYGAYMLPVLWDIQAPLSRRYARPCFYGTYRPLFVWDIHATIPVEHTPRARTPMFVWDIQALSVSVVVCQSCCIVLWLKHFRWLVRLAVDLGKALM